MEGKLKMESGEFVMKENVKKGWWNVILRKKNGEVVMLVGKVVMKFVDVSEEVVSEG